MLEVGDVIELVHGAEGCRLKPGDRLTVTQRHPMGRVLADKRIAVRVVRQDGKTFLVGEDGHEPRPVGALMNIDEDDVGGHGGGAEYKWSGTTPPPWRLVRAASDYMSFDVYDYAADEGVSCGLVLLAGAGATLLAGVAIYALTRPPAVAAQAPQPSPPPKTAGG